MNAVKGLTSSISEGFPDPDDLQLWIEVGRNISYTRSSYRPPNSLVHRLFERCGSQRGVLLASFRKPRKSVILGK